MWYVCINIFVAYINITKILLKNINKKTHTKNLKKVPIQSRSPPALILRPNEILHNNEPLLKRRKCINQKKQPNNMNNININNNNSMNKDFNVDNNNNNSNKEKQISLVILGILNKYCMQFFFVFLLYVHKNISR